MVFAVVTSDLTTWLQTEGLTLAEIKFRVIFRETQSRHYYLLEQ